MTENQKIPSPEDTRTSVEIEQDHQQRIFLKEQQEKIRRIKLYQAFQNSFLHPKCDVVYYPGCADDDAAIDAFPKSEVIFVEINRSFIEVLRQRKHGPNAHIIEASVVDYEPGPVNVLILHGMTDVDISRAINAIVDGGFILTGCDGAFDLRRMLNGRSDLVYVGTFHPKKIGTGEVLSTAQIVQVETGDLAPEVNFTTGTDDDIHAVETDEEFSRVTPQHFNRFRKEVELVMKGSSESKDHSVLNYAAQYVPIPPRHFHALPDESLYVFQKKSRV